MAQVWEMDVDHPEQLVLLALADWADDDGGHLFPPQRLVAWKTGYSERQVRRILHGLIEQGALMVLSKGGQTKGGTYRTTEYRLRLDMLNRKDEYMADDTPAIVSGSRADILSGDTPDKSGQHTGQIGSTHRTNRVNTPDIATADQPSVEPSVEPSVQPSVPRARARQRINPVAFEEFWANFPTARKGARRPTLVAWERALRRASPAEIVAGARRYRDDPNREDAYTAGAAAWLNRDGWEEGPLPVRRNGRGTKATGAARTHELAERLRAAGR